MGKYYTPTIEEFHVDFEYEKGVTTHAKPKMKWISKVYTGADDLCTNQFINKAIRVKHLDREDIESLGWEGDEMEAWKDDKRRFLYHKKCTTPRGEQNCSILHVPYTNWIMIYFSTGEFGSYVWELPEDKITFTGGTAFAGVIKNKSELKRVLTQIGVI